MPLVVKQTGPPVPGNLHVVVIEAAGIRANAAGGLTSPLVRLRTRAMANPKAQDTPVFETSAMSSNCNPKWEEEFTLEVKDANQTQLEVTIWDTAEMQPFPGPFMGECILNLSKLVPYQGEVIMQDFDVKQGKQHKTQVQACGKLVLQLEFRGAEMSAEPAPASPVRQPSVQAPPGQEQFQMNIVLVEAKDLAKKQSHEIDSYVCVALLDDPGSLETRHFHALDHGIGPGSRDTIVLTPQHRTRVVTSTYNPTWGDGCSLREAHPTIKLVEKAQQDGQGPASKAPLVGQPVLLMFTVRNHVEDCSSQDGFLGRVVLPQIRAGQPVDQWFVLQTLEGKELIGPSGQQSQLRVQIFYGPASEMQQIGEPYTIPHPNPNHAPDAAAAPAPAGTQAVPQTPPLPTNAGREAPVVPPLPVHVRAPTPDSWVRPSTPQIIQTFAGTQFAFYLEIVEARNLATPGGGAVSNPFASISLIHDPNSMEKQDFFLIDHLTSSGVDVRFLQLPPQHTSKKNAGNSEFGNFPVWNDACTLKGTHPGIKRILELKAQNQLASSTEVVPLSGQTVLLLATVHDANAPSGAGFIGRVVIPQIRAGQPIDQWFMLHGREGSQIKDPEGQDAAIRLRFAYGALKEAEPELPPGWEKKVDDATGKIFYVNHELKTFSWVVPPKTVPTPPSIGPSQSAELSGPAQNVASAGPGPVLPPAETQPDDIVSAGMSAPAEPAKEATRGTEGGTRVLMTIREGKDLPRMDHLSLSNAYICVSIIGEADNIDAAVCARLQHDVSKNKLRAGLRSSMLKLHPLGKTKVVNRSLNPKWSEDLVFCDGYLNVAAIEELQQKGSPKEGNREQLQGTPILILITVHHEVSGSEDTPIGRIVLPVVKPGQQIDEWLPLLTNDGTPQVGGMNEKPSQINVHIEYQAEGASSHEQEEQVEQSQEKERERLEYEAQERLRQEQQAKQEEEERQRAAEKKRQEQEEEERQKKLHEEEEEKKLQEEEERQRQRETLEREADAARQQQQMEIARQQQEEAAQAQRRMDEQEQRRLEEEEATRREAIAEQQRIQEAAQRRMQEEEQKRIARGRELAFQAKPENSHEGTAGYAVDLQLRLALDLSVAGPVGSPTRAAFEHDLLDDLAQASGLGADSFRIKKLSAGSIIVDAEIYRDPSGMGPDPKHVAAEFERQARDPNSPLSRGKLTCYLESIVFRPPAGQPMPAVFPPKPGMHQARLAVSVLQARNLPQTHQDGCNAFCELALERFGHEDVVFAKTSTAISSCNPRWDQQFIQGVDAERIANSQLTLSVYDWSPEAPRRVLGQIRKLRLSDLMAESKSKVWFDIFTQEGMPLGSPQYQASICVGLECQAPAVEASVDVSPARTAASANTRYIEDSHPLITWQGSPMLAALAANKVPPMPASPGRSPTLLPAANLNSPALGTVASPRGSHLMSTLDSGAMMPPRPMGPNMSEAGLGIVLTVGPRGEYVVDSLLEGGPAAQSNKILQNDVLLDVDGHAIVGKPLFEIQSMLAGEVHSPVTMTFARLYGNPSNQTSQQIIVTLCRKKLPAGPSSSSPAWPEMSISLRSQEAIIPSARPIAVRSAAPAPMAPPEMNSAYARAPSPAGSRTSTSSRRMDFSSIGDSATRMSSMEEEAQRRAADLRRKESEVSALHSFDSRGIDPLAHLKEQFAELMDDLHGSENDPEMAATLAWKRKLLFGNASIKSPEGKLAA